MHDIQFLQVQKWMEKAEEIKKYLEVKKLNTNENNSVEKDQQEEAAEKSILNNGETIVFLFFVLPIFFAPS